MFKSPWVSSGNGVRIHRDTAASINSVLRHSKGKAPFVGAIISGSRASVSTDTVSIEGTDTAQVTIPAIVTNKSILLFSHYTDGTLDDASWYAFTGRIVNSTTLEFKRSAVYNGKYVYLRWYLIEFESSVPITIQHSSEITLTSTTQNEVINSIDTNHAFPILSMRRTSADLHRSDNVSIELTTSTNAQLKVSNTDGNQLVAFQIIEHSNWNVSVYYEQMTTGDTSKTKTITSVDKDSTMLFQSAYDSSGTGSLGGNCFSDICLLNNTTVSLERSSGAGAEAFEFIIYIVETTGDVSVQHKINEQIASGSSENTTNITTVNQNSSAIHCPNTRFNIPYHNSSMDTGSWLYCRHDFVSDTQIKQIRGLNPLTIVQNSPQVLEFKSV